MTEPEGDDPQPGYDWRGLLRGVRAAASLAGLVMAASFVGFGALLRSLNFDLLLGLSTIPVIWALPGQVVFVDSIHKGLGFFATALAVSITAVRLMPITALVLSRTRVKSAPRWPEFVAAHFVAITLWLLSNQKLDAIPYRQRLPWLIGLGATLCTSMIGLSWLGYFLADTLPLPLAATLVFLTPSFFLVSLLSGIRWRFEYSALLIGAVLGPLTYSFAPELDLFIAGLIGGTTAFLLAHRMKSART